MFQNFLFLFHSDGLTVGYSNVRLSISCYLNLWQLRKCIYQLQNCYNLCLLFLKKDLNKTDVMQFPHNQKSQKPILTINIRRWSVKITDFKIMESGVQKKKKTRRYHTVFVKLLNSKSCTFTFQQYFV